jgi:hypothetical protein
VSVTYGREMNRETFRPECTIDPGRRQAWRPMSSPLFILSAPRSFTSVVCAMLGQHPDMYGLLETGLFNAGTMEAWWETARPAGLLRCVAELFFCDQSDEAVRCARAWLKRRLNFSTAYIFELIAERVAPRIPVDKTPAMAFDLEAMYRTNEMFPNARYLHLLRHPRGQCESVMNHGLRMAAEQHTPPPRWLRHLAPIGGVAVPEAVPNRDLRRDPVLRDPQWGWYTLHNNIIEFLESVPRDRKITIRGEDLLANPDEELSAIVNWLGLSDAPESIEEMKHPERGPFSFVGPPSARFGTSRYFLQQPELRTDRAAPLSLEGPLAWREDGGEFAPRVKRLARYFGYA